MCITVHRLANVQSSPSLVLLAAACAACAAFRTYAQNAVSLRRNYRCGSLLALQCMLRFTREGDRLVDPILFLYMPPYSSLLVAWHICVHALFSVRLCTVVLLSTNG